MAMSNSTNDGARTALCGCKLRGEAMEIRLRAIWRAAVEPGPSLEETGAEVTVVQGLAFKGAPSTFSSAAICDPKEANKKRFVSLQH